MGRPGYEAILNQKLVSISINETPYREFVHLDNEMQRNMKTSQIAKFVLRRALAVQDFMKAFFCMYIIPSHCATVGYFNK